MKSTSNERPSILQKLGLNLWAYNYNVIEKTGSENEIVFEFETLVFDRMPTPEEAIGAVIRDKYTVDEEIKLSYKREGDSAEFLEHEEFVSAVKLMVKNDFENDENFAANRPKDSWKKYI